MKMVQCTISFEKLMHVTAYFPEGTSTSEIDRIAREVADGSIKEWDEPDWDVHCSFVKTVDIPDDELQPNPPNKFGYRKPPKIFTDEDTVTVDDDGEDLVDPSDATWWIPSDENTP